MKQLSLTVKFTLSPLLLLLLLLLWFDRCETLTDNSLPPIFFPFGTDEGDSVVTVFSGGFFSRIPCDGPINIPYKIFNNRTLYVSSTCSKQNKINDF